MALDGGRAPRRRTAMTRRAWCWLLTGAFVVAGCGAGQTEQTATAPSTTTSSPTTTTTAPAPPATFPRPVDDEGLRCQAVIDERLAELAHVRPPNMDAVCRHRDSDPWLGARGSGAYFQALRPGLIVVGYPRPGPPGWDEAVWRAAVTHELGHAWDASLLVRASSLPRYREIRGASMIEPANEDYADVFAAVVGGITGADGIGLRYIGQPPPPAQTDQLCAEGLLPC